MTTKNEDLNQTNNPYEGGILKNFNGTLDASTVSSILADHSITISDYLDDLGLHKMPETTDAKKLNIWLGY